MTIIVKCQHTGIEFEAASKRTKNHPTVARLLNEAANDKHNPTRYRATVNALAEARKAGMTNIDEIVAFVNEVVADGLATVQARRRAEADAQREQERSQKEARQRRRELNDYLYRHGYRWYKETEEDRDFHAGFQNDPEIGRWILHAPDGRHVSVEEALQEIG